MNEQLQYPPVHTLIYGEAHMGKSTFVRTMPTPMLVFFFDPFGKDQPYLEIPETQVVDAGVDSFGTPRRQVIDAQGNLLFQLEYYHDLDPNRPTAAQRFLSRLVKIHEEFSFWRTVAVDSLTFLERIIFINEKYVLNKTAKDGRQWYAGVREMVEESLMIRFGGFPMNIAVIAHDKTTMNDVTGEIVRGVNAVGQLSRTFSVAFNELYRIYISNDASKKRLLQTQPNAIWTASSGIHAPDPCEPHYAALWANFRPDLYRTQVV